MAFVSGNTYANTAGTSSGEEEDTCYYNFDDNNRKPETAITVGEFPDVVLQSEFRQELNKQFDVRSHLINQANSVYIHVFG